MAYTSRDATVTLFGYLNLDLQQTQFINNTNNRGFIYTHSSGESCVIFIYPISHKADDSKNFFDTRDSGAYERGVTWNYALEHKMKYFCFAVHDQVPRYCDYVFSLECNEKTIEEVSGTVGGARAGSGTQVVIPNDYHPNKDFERIFTKNGFYISVIHRDHVLDYIEKYDNRPYLLDDKMIDLSNLDNNETSDNKIVQANIKGENLLIYGVPGCGKSYYIDENYTLTADNSERIVFHPDYTYSDFVGQILPKVITLKNSNGDPVIIKDDNGNEIEQTLIDYKFISGPFTRLLKKCENSDEMHYLIIEEINRGNAPAIFGEVFQLLDRSADTAFSQYSINNEDIALEVYGKKTHPVKIPSNLTILATMNTADQNVFTLDTAFKRRWKMKAIRNKFTNDEHCSVQLCGTNLKWKDFATKINAKIIEASEENLGSEDKRLGVYFLKDEEMSHCGAFSEKVLMYLWNDVFKFDKSKVFDDKYKTLEDLLDAFANEKIRFNIFSSDLGFRELIATPGEKTEGEADE